MDELLYCLHVDPSVDLTGVLLSSLTGCRHWRIHLGKCSLQQPAHHTCIENRNKDGFYLRRITVVRFYINS